MGKSKITIRNIISYIQGNINYKLYYSKKLYGIDLSWLIPSYYREQIDMRVNSMRRECYEGGSCVVCGCKTTALQMCNKACDGNCYPSMISRKGWRMFKEVGLMFDKVTRTFWQLRGGKFQLFKNNSVNDNKKKNN